MLRCFLSITIIPIVGASLAFDSKATEPETPPKKPNVLLILSDDLSTALSGFGHPQCKTPELDKLAKRGISFRRMYCQFPLCGPSRSSIMNGLYPYSTGDFGNATKFRKKIPEAVTLPELFKKNGYYVGRVSKIYHMGIPQDIIAGETDDDDAQSWTEAFNMKCGEQHMEGKKIDHSPNWPNSQTFVRVEAEEDDLGMVDGLAATKAIQLMTKHKDEPFFIALGFIRPHVPLVAPKKYFKEYPVGEMQLPEVPANDLDDVAKVTSKYKTTESMGMNEEGIRGTLSAYYATVTHMDAQVGRVLTALEELGLSDKTIVVFSSDHGYHLGEHHKWQKQHLFEETARVPFILSVPWIKSTQGRATQKMCELIDLYPTISDLCSLKAPNYLQGQSMKPILEDPKTPMWDKSTALTISTKGGVSLRTEKWRYTEWGKGKKQEVELYDLDKDPREFTNVAKLVEYKEARKELAEQLRKKKIAAGYTE